MSLMPIILCPTVEEKRAVMRAVYDAGWTWVNTTGDLAYVLRRCASHTSDLGFTHIHLHTNRTFFHCGPLSNHLSMNSPRHMVEYCRRLGTNGPRAPILRDVRLS